MKKTDYKFIYTFRVRYAEVDAQGIVFNAHYLTYFDCLITEYYRKLKYNYALEVKKHQKDYVFLMFFKVRHRKTQGLRKVHIRKQCFFEGF